MSESKTKDTKKPVSDINPYTKSNAAFRRRHDISLNDFNKSAKRYQMQHG